MWLYFGVVGLELPQKYEVAMLRNVDPQLDLALGAGGHFEGDGGYYVLDQQGFEYFLSVFAADEDGWYGDLISSAIVDHYD